MLYQKYLMYFILSCKQIRSWCVDFSGFIYSSTAPLSFAPVPSYVLCYLPHLFPSSSCALLYFSTTGHVFLPAVFHFISLLQLWSFCLVCISASIFPFLSEPERPEGAHLVDLLKNTHSHPHTHLNAWRHAVLRAPRVCVSLCVCVMENRKTVVALHLNPLHFCSPFPSLFHAWCMLLSDRRPETFSARLYFQNIQIN